MARNIAWVVAALLLVPASGRAAGLGEIAVCDREQAPQQRGGHPATAAKADPAAPKSDKDKDKPSSPRPERPKWWIDAKLRAELGITDQQSAALEAIWQKGLPMRIEGRERQEKLEATLSQMILTAVDEASFVAQLDKVEAARSESNKARLLMLYRMNRILRPEQRLKLDAKAKAMREQREPPRRDPSPGKS